MLPSHEQLDRPGGLSRKGLTGPLRRNADFRALWLAMCISLVGDGVFLVAIAWQVYELSSGPTALAMVAQLFALATMGLMAVIGATGNYGFFELLTVVLCLPLLCEESAPAAVPVASESKEAAARRFMDRTGLRRSTGSLPKEKRHRGRHRGSCGPPASPCPARCGAREVSPAGRRCAAPLRAARSARPPHRPAAD